MYREIIIVPLIIIPIDLVYFAVAYLYFDYCKGKSIKQLFSSVQETQKV